MKTILTSLLAEAPFPLLANTKEKGPLLAGKILTRCLRSHFICNRRTVYSSNLQKQIIAPTHGMKQLDITCNKKVNMLPLYSRSAGTCLQCKSTILLGALRSMDIIWTLVPHIHGNVSFPDNAVVSCMTVRDVIL